MNNKKNIIIATFAMLLVVFIVGFMHSPLASYTKVKIFEDSEAGAKEMTEFAYSYYRKHGLDAIVKAVNEGDPLFKEQILYAIIVRGDGKILAHGVDPEIIGRNIATLIDISGKNVGEEVLSMKDKGWVEYYWVNPATNRVQRKRTYVIYEDNTYICVGVYVSEQ